MLVWSIFSWKILNFFVCVISFVFKVLIFGLRDLNIFLFLLCGFLWLFLFLSEGLWDIFCSFLGGFCLRLFVFNECWWEVRLLFLCCLLVVLGFILLYVLGVGENCLLISIFLVLICIFFKGLGLIVFLE